MHSMIRLDETVNPFTLTILLTSQCKDIYRLELKLFAAPDWRRNTRASGVVVGSTVRRRTVKVFANAKHKMFHAMFALRENVSRCP